MALTGSVQLFGREREQQVLLALLDNVQAQGGALLLRGDAGIGKSALVAQAAGAASERGFRILRADGVQSESELPFAGLYQLLHPVIDHADALPAPQRDALASAFGTATGGTPDRFLVGLATLNLLAELATGAPVLLIAEDAQWLDRPTCDVLAFVARRLSSDPIVLIAAIREGFATSLDLADLPELLLQGLPDEEGDALLRSRAPQLSPAGRRRLLAESAGNPLALLELSSALQPGTAADGPEPLPLTARLEQAFLSRMRDLPPDTLAALLVAAAADRGDLDEVTAAASILTRAALTQDVLEPAATARLVEIKDDSLQFRHPLIRSAVYQAASGPRRRAAHAALAEVLSAQAERRAWHRAASISGPDDGVADELDAAAQLARQKGGIAVAVSALERSAQLTNAPALRGSRLLQAAELAFDLGRPDLVTRLMREAAGLDLSHPDRARLLWLESLLDVNTGDPAMLAALVQAAAGMQHVGETSLAMRLLTAAALRCYWADPPPAMRQSVVAGLEALALPHTDPGFLLALAYAAPIERGSMLLRTLDAIDPAQVDDAIACLYLGTAAALITAFEISAAFISRAVPQLRQEGRLGLLTQALMVRAFDETYLGHWELALPAADEARMLAEESGQPLWLSGAQSAQAQQAAIRGDSEAADALAANAGPVAMAAGSSATLASIQLGLGLASLARGDYAEAYARLVRPFQPGDPSYHFIRCWSIGELAEAAVHCGKKTEARELLASMEVIAERSPAPWLHVGIAYARAILADDRDARQLYETALANDLTAWPFVRGRLHMAYGSWLRRHRRVTQSREFLRAARDTFDELGAVPWGDRARGELRAAGEASQDRRSRSFDRLTPQELQIARMAAQRLSNREIGQQLFLSPRTVSSHLYRIFPKLGITSRAKLAEALEE